MTDKQHPPAGFTYITTGRVLDTLAAPCWYNVKTSAEVPIPCSDSTGFGSFGRIGPSKLGLYTPGTHVVVLVRTVQILQSDKSIETMIMPGFIFSRSE